MSINTPVPLKIAPRQPSDLAGTLRFTSLAGGYDKAKAQSYYREELEPSYYDAQNIDAYSREGKWQLCPAINQIGATEGSDHEYLAYTFNQAVYKFPTVTGVAADIQKVTQPSGAPVWAAIANPYGGTLPIKGGVVWKDQLVLASGEVGANALRVMSKTEVWSVIAAVAPAPTTAAVLMVGIAPDDKLMVWFDQNGMFDYDGTSWRKLFPIGTELASQGTCDMIVRAVGSTIFVTRDTSDLCTIYEYSIEATGTVFIAWVEDPGMRIWPQGLDVYHGAAWFVARLGSRSNRGILYRKEKLAAPEPIAFLYTNLQTDGQKSLDWGWRCVRAFGDVLMVGGSSREDHTPALYRVTEDDSGIIIHPTSNAPGVVGPFYSIAVLPSSAAGVAGTERLFLTGAARTFYKDRDDGDDPTSDAYVGFIQLPDIDYGAEDRAKTGRFVEASLLTKSTGGTVEIQYRVDPPTPTAPWSSLGFVTTATSPTTPPARFHLPDDNAMADIYGTHFRILQLRTKFTRATSGLVRDIMESLALDVVELRPPGL